MHIALPRTTPLLLIVLLAACGGGGGDAPATVTPPVPQTLALSGAATEVLAGGAGVALTATTAVAATVNWSLAQGPGKLSAATGGSVSYIPPADGVSVNTPVQIQASSGGLSQSYRLTLFPDPGQPGLRLIAGTLGSKGNLDGDADAARFTDISAMAPDANGNLYLLDNGLLRKVDADGRVSTLAPTGVLSVSVAPDNIVYLLAKLDDKKVVLTLQADGATSVYLNADQTAQTADQLVAAAGGKLYLLGANYVRVAGAAVDAPVAGDQFDFAACADGVGTAAHLGSIADAVLEADGNLLLQACASVRRVTPAGVVTTLAGPLLSSPPPDQQVDGSGAAARFGNLPYASLTTDRDGDIRVLDLVSDATAGLYQSLVNYRLRDVSQAGVVRTLAQGATRAYNSLIYGAYGRPTPLRAVRYLSNGKLIVASAAQLWQADAQGALRRYAGDEGDIVSDNSDSLATARFVNPRAAAADLAGNLYLLTNPDFGQVLGYKIAPDGAISRFMQDAAGLAQPTQLLLAPDGGFYLVTRGYPSVLGHSPGSFTVLYKLSSAGVPQLLAGGPYNILSSADAVDGAGADARFFAAELLGLDADGNLYARDSDRYRKITPAGVVSTVATLPAGVGVTADGYRYEADRAAGLVYRVGADGVRTVVAGTAGQDGNRIGALPGSLKRTASASGFSEPPALVLAPIGPSSFVLVSGGALLKLVLPH